MSADEKKEMLNNSPSGDGRMEYDFRRIEKNWQDKWKKDGVYKVSNPSPGSGQVPQPKYYVLDMFPYPSGAGLHVGHPLGYIASDIYARYKRLKGFNVLHPMGYDAFGLPAEQYAIDHGIHPAVSTKQNIENFRKQLDKIGFSFDWDREVNTSDPHYYKWTQWIFLQLFSSFYNRKTNKAEKIDTLIASFEKEGTATHGSRLTAHDFTAAEWKAFDEKQKMDVLMDHRLAYCGYGEVNWCEALGTVLANDEVINGVSERGGYPVIKKKLRQWYLRITEYADRLLEGLERIDFSEAMKEMQTNWIGKSSGAEIIFRLTPNPSPGGEGNNADPAHSGKFFPIADKKNWGILKDLSRENRKNKTEAEDFLWQELRNNKLDHKVRRQYVIDGFIIDFAFLEKKLLIETDGGYHNEKEQKEYDKARIEYLMERGYKVIRFTNEQVINSKDEVIRKIKEELNSQSAEGPDAPLSAGRGAGGETLELKVYTTRPDTIFGVDFMVIAPEHELAEQITTAEQKQAVDEYIAYVKSRSERERMAEKKITGVFTGAYALNPFNRREIPVWISEYVLAGYGTGAIMAVPCGDERDHKFAKHFNIPVTNIIGKYYNGEEANPTKDVILENSDFLNGMVMKDAVEVVIKEIEEMGIGERKVNYKMRDAAFSRQRYWGEPFPVIWKNGIAYPLDEKELPLKLPEVENYKPGPEGEGPLANIPEWYLIPNPSPQAEKGAVGAANVPKYTVHTPVQYELARMMRKDYTEAEDVLWQLLRNSQLGVKFRRQHPVDSYIVDFISLQDKLIVEIDGGYHDTEEQKKYDEDRTRILKEIGFDVIRLSNAEVIKNPYSVRDKIKSELGARIPSPLAERGQGVRETNTMPGYAGSSWYFLRYMDPHNDKAFCDRKASDYWGQVDLYIGGTEHAVGHLLYSRMWTKALYDLGYIGHDEPYKKLVNQGMIQGSSRFIYRLVAFFAYTNSNELVSLEDKYNKSNPVPIFISTSLKGESEEYLKGLFFELSKKYKVNQFFNSIKEEDFTIMCVGMRVDVNLVDGLELDIEKFRTWKKEYANAVMETEDDGKFLSYAETEKMSKSKFNTVNPDDLVDKYGADTFRMYEMFLGPVEMSKPWDTKGIEGVSRFLKKFWRLFADEAKGLIVTDEQPTAEELKVLHKAIKKIEDDTERFSFNTGVSSFMIATNELTDLKCHKRSILEPLLILLTPYAPHICEELWSLLGNKTSILNASYPKFEEKYVKESSKAYPVAINGKTRTELTIALDATQPQVEEMVLADEIVRKWLDGKRPKKIIYVKNKMINVVI